jgi:hypothetical protein
MDTTYTHQLATPQDIEMEKEYIQVKMIKEVSRCD